MCRAAKVMPGGTLEYVHHLCVKDSHLFSEVPLIVSSHCEGLSRATCPVGCSLVELARTLKRDTCNVGQLTGIRTGAANPNLQI